ncbi:hypothetical protein HDU84_003469 [Entophlyctis sp. JEL0112]|nr:hypothetical protein HDU84_003469 [Entophlyctis sp. JEL0112]
MSTPTAGDFAERLRLAIADCAPAMVPSTGEDEQVAVQKLLARFGDQAHTSCAAIVRLRMTAVQHAHMAVNLATQARIMEELLASDAAAASHTKTTIVANVGGDRGARSESVSSTASSSRGGIHAVAAPASARVAGMATLLEPVARSAAGSTLVPAPQMQLQLPLTLARRGTQQQQQLMREPGGLGGSGGRTLPRRLSQQLPPRQVQQQQQEQQAERGQAPTVRDNQLAFGPSSSSSSSATVTATSLDDTVIIAPSRLRRSRSASSIPHTPPPLQSPAADSQHQHQTYPQQPQGQLLRPDEHEHEERLKQLEHQPPQLHVLQPSSLRRMFSRDGHPNNAHAAAGDPAAMDLQSHRQTKPSTTFEMPTPANTPPPPPLIETPPTPQGQQVAGGGSRSVLAGSTIFSTKRDTSSSSSLLQKAERVGLNIGGANGSIMPSLRYHDFLEHQHNKQKAAMTTHAASSAAGGSCAFNSSAGVDGGFSPSSTSMASSSTTTLPSLQTQQQLHCDDAMNSRGGLSGRTVVAYDEEDGGVWAGEAASRKPSVNTVATGSGDRSLAHQRDLKLQQQHTRNPENLNHYYQPQLVRESAAAAATAGVFYGVGGSTKELQQQHQHYEPHEQHRKHRGSLIIDDQQLQQNRSSLVGSVEPGLSLFQQNHRASGTSGGGGVVTFDDSTLDSRGTGSSAKQLYQQEQQREKTSTTDGNRLRRVRSSSFVLSGNDSNNSGSGSSAGGGRRGSDTKSFFANLRGLVAGGISNGGGSGGGASSSSSSTARVVTNRQLGVVVPSASGTSATVASGGNGGGWIMPSSNASNTSGAGAAATRGSAGMWKR